MKFLTLGVVSTMLAAQSRAQEPVAAPPAPPAQTYVYNKTSVSNTISYQGQQDDQDGGKTKSVSKSFTVDRNDKVNVASTFGSVTIKTWEKNEVKVEANISAFANSDDEAQKLLDGTTVEVNKNGDVVSVKTNMQEKNGNWGRGSRNGKSWRKEVKTIITIYMPSRNALTVSQQYGNVTVGNLAGATSFKVQYGDLSTGDLSSSNNFVNVQYGKAVLQNVNQADVKVQYGGGLTIGNINNLELEIQYASANITSIKNNAQMKVQYGGGVKIGSAGSLSLNTQYAGLNIGKLNGTITCNAQYGGGVRIDQIESGAKTVNIHTQYAPVSLGFSDNYNADFNVKTSYSSLKYPSGMEVKNTGDADDRTNKSYTGKIGRGGAANINISSSYMGVTFK